MNQAGSNTEYAYWTAAEKSFTVTYSLAVFHEIDFQVNEAFRRIPHGGVETGGLLFGTLAQNTAKIEAFRGIECEHASGPSFHLSERDLEGLGKQLAAAPSDPELEGLEVLGWFVAHTRSPLQMNEREVVLFEQLFAGPGRIMLLIKPERFQPTRFGFIVRAMDGGVDPNAAPNAVILPLPGRAGRPVEAPAASIPAPVERAAPAASPLQPPVEEASPNNVPSAPQPVVLPPSEAAAPSFWRDVPVGPQREEPILRIQEPLLPGAGKTKELAVLPSITRPDILPSGALLPGALPPIEEIRRRRAEKVQPSDSLDRGEGRQRITRQMPQEGRRSSLRLLSLLLLAAGLGCGLGYFAYLQLPSATIPLAVRRQASSLLVTWPAADTSDALSAEIRVDDGEPKPLSLQQRAAGEALVAAHSDSVKIELIAQHRLRDSRGIVRYVRGNVGR